MRRRKGNIGFSLVELIIVVAIMAVLAASLAPSLIRYIKKSRESRAITEASNFVSATENGFANINIQNAPTCLDKTFQKSNGTTVKCGVITNEMLSKAVSGSGNEGDEDYADYLLACEIISDISTKTDKFKHASGTAESPIGKSCSDFDDCIGIIIVYNEKEQVVMLEYYTNGILVHYEDGEYTISESNSFISGDRIAY